MASTCSLTENALHVAATLANVVASRWPRIISRAASGRLRRDTGSWLIALRGLCAWRLLVFVWLRILTGILNGGGGCGTKGQYDCERISAKRVSLVGTIVESITQPVRSAAAQKVSKLCTMYVVGFHTI